MLHPRCTLPFVVCAALLDLGTLSGCKAQAQSPLLPEAFGAHLGYRSPLPPEIDADRDGLADEEEHALATRFAPVLTLHRDDWTRPASVEWLMDRMNLEVVHTSASATVIEFGAYPRDVRAGSSDPADRVTYYHAFPSSDGGVDIQYWFFYPYNDGPLFFDHDADWEHVTVALDADRNPRGVWAARHADNAPGRWRAWERIRKLDDTHPEVLSAMGSHASYFDRADARWYDKVGVCPLLAGPCDHILWNTWEGGGLRNMGERHAPLDVASMKPIGPWGEGGIVPGTAAPAGPAHQRGWCVSGSPSCSGSF